METTCVHIDMCALSETNKEGETFAAERIGTKERRVESDYCFKIWKTTKRATTSVTDFYKHQFQQSTRTDIINVHVRDIAKSQQERETTAFMDKLSDVTLLADEAMREIEKRI